VIALLSLGAVATIAHVWYALAIRKKRRELCVVGREGARHDVPGPHPRMLACGNLVDLVRLGPLEAVARYTQLPSVRSARSFVFWVGTKPHVVVLDPELIMEVLTCRDGTFVRTESVTEELFRHGLINSTGDRWKTRRELLNPGFRQEVVRSAVPRMVECVDELAERWRDRNGERFNPIRDLSGLTLRILGKVVYGFEFDPEKHGGRMLHRSEAVVSARAVLRLYLPSFLATLYERRRAREANEHFDMIIDDVLHAAERAQASGEQSTPVMRSLLEALAAGTLSRDEVRDEIFGLLIAGHETSATALTWIIALLAKHQDIQRKCWEELEERPLSHDAVERLILLKQVVREALRMFPPVPISLRTTTRRTQLGEIAMPAGTQIHIYSALTHRNPRLWDDAERFEPARFEHGVTSKMSRCHYAPYLVGPHTCIGMHLANLELATVAARLLHHFKLDFHGELREDFRVSLHPSGFTLSLHARDGRYRQ
jgi:PHYB activation tagged suppressor 1